MISSIFIDSTRVVELTLPLVVYLLYRLPDMSFCVLSTLIISVLLHHSLERFFITSSTTGRYLFFHSPLCTLIMGP